ncbi:MAG: hypothetical protein B7X08_01760 [Acidocella sp. 20-63-7]|nr:MAG: hypothetical protein B7X08_01760 [Acidocella sp. 20-63-7]HQT46131.1 DUF2244 domain-containing protein [Acidocella sp.]
MDVSAASASPALLRFEAVIRPHRSLSARAMFGVILAWIAAAAFLTSLLIRLGAWPVIVLNLAATALAVFLLILNIRAARACETLRLTEENLTVHRMDMHGTEQNFTLPAAWLNVVLEEPPGTVPKLLLTARRTTLEVAHSLGESQKRDLAAALNRALHRARNPIFDNPQLR